MQNRFLKLCLICGVLFSLLIMGGCKGSLRAVKPGSEQYEYTQREKTCFFPSFTNENEKTEILSVSTEDGYFVCMTTDEARADLFVNSQRTLLRFLQANGVELRELSYVGINFDDNFSESGKDNAYIAFSSAETWRQVLVTLQALWGDFTDYGYVYAMANAVAAQLGWETDAVILAEQGAMDEFFCQNPQALNLLYPAFTELYATEETVWYSKSLSLSLFGHIDLGDALKKPVETQLDEFEKLLLGYSGEIGAQFSPQTFGYAYRGTYLPLCIQTTYATHIVDRGYVDYFAETYGDIFSDYVTVYQTAENLDRETVEAVRRFDLEDRAGNVNVNWLSEYSAETKYAKRRINLYYFGMREIYVTTVFFHSDEYYHHVAYLINPDSAVTGSWQNQAFCEIGRSYSPYALLAAEYQCTQDPKSAELFNSFAGHDFRPGRDDYYEAMDISCYALDELRLSLDQSGSGPSINSITHYLIGIYGEDAVIDLMLYPDTVFEVTGKSWETLEAEWKQQLGEKYAGKEIPDWLWELR